MPILKFDFGHSYLYNAYNASEVERDEYLHLLENNLTETSNDNNNSNKNDNENNNNEMKKDDDDLSTNLINSKGEKLLDIIKFVAQGNSTIDPLPEWVETLKN